MADFHGYPAGDIQNEYIRLRFLTGAGPRIVGAYLPGSAENLFAELPSLVMSTPLGSYRFYGGHRLWHAPEAMPRSYTNDDTGLELFQDQQQARLIGAIDPATGIQKEMEIQLAADRASARVTHRLRNTGLWAVELAPWAITQLKLGGIAILPLNTTTPDPYLPNSQLVLWPYNRMNDPRLEFREHEVLIHATPAKSPFKVGTFSTRGWIAYYRDGTLMVRRFTPQPSLPHPDQNCNLEIFSSDSNVEIETLGPLVRLEPGADVIHLEEWEWHTGVAFADIEKLLS